MNKWRDNECRHHARSILEDFQVAAPEEIDLDTIAWRVGKLRIEYGGLDTAEGRIVASPKGGGTIRVTDRGSNLGRRRFTVAHEIGHFILHLANGLDREDTVGNFVIWNDSGEETEANTFAAELLMPEFLMVSHSEGREPSLSLVDSLADKFRTSSLATAIQFTNYTREQVALVVSRGTHMERFFKSKSFWPRIRWGQIHPDSAAGERLAHKASDSRKMVDAPAYAWLEGFDDKSDSDIMEDSRYLEHYDRTLTLLWLKEDIGQGQGYSDS